MTSSPIKTKIAVFGASSMVGSRFCDLAVNVDVIKADLNGEIPVDITDKNSIEAFFNKYEFDYLILFSAFTNVDAAELQRNDKGGICWKVNVEGTANVCLFCETFKKKLIYISTDFVFDGENGPQLEEASFGPNLNKVSWYGVSKIEAEKIVHDSAGFLILRISYPYRANHSDKTDFARSILENFQKGNLYPMFADQIITPTFADDLAPAVTLLIEKDLSGIYHIASPVVTTPYEFANYLIEKSTGKTKEVKKGSLKTFLEKGNTPRPVNGGLICDKITKLGFKPTNWRIGVEKLIEQSKQ